MTTIAELGAFLAREAAAAAGSEPKSDDTEQPVATPVVKPVAVVPANGKIGAGTSGA